MANMLAPQTCRNLPLDKGNWPIRRRKAQKTDAQAPSPTGHNVYTPSDYRSRSIRRLRSLNMRSIQPANATSTTGPNFQEQEHGGFSKESGNHLSQLSGPSSDRFISRKASKSCARSCAEAYRRSVVFEGSALRSFQDRDQSLVQAIAVAAGLAQGSSTPALPVNWQPREARPVST